MYRTMYAVCVLRAWPDRPDLLTSADASLSQQQTANSDAFSFELFSSISAITLTLAHGTCYTAYVGSYAS